MRMVAARIEGYRRFESTSTLDLTPRVVARVGPNEAGKSSLLDALENLTTRGSLEFDERDFSGWVQPAQKTAVLSALFEVEAADKEALAAVPGGEKVRLWQLSRDSNGGVVGRVFPYIERDPKPRLALAGDLERMLARGEKKHRRFLATRMNELPGAEKTEVGEAQEPPPPEPTVAELAEAALEDLRGSAETLSEEAYLRLEELGRALERVPVGSPAYMKDLRQALFSLADEHQGETPNDRAFAILDKRTPRVKVLRDADRQLQTGYRFEDHEEAPAPLENLLALAEVDWQSLKAAAARPENPELENLLHQANGRLEERLHSSWRQSVVSVRLSQQDGQLNVFPYDAESASHSKIEERSDGFKSFLALLAFTARHTEDQRKLILCIDEAERHLHYDAQVDLVGELTRQTFATQIIYTTHSAGCLPEDLGSGIRVVKQCAGDRSQIENGFWSAQEGSEHSVAFTSLLMAMGADAVAFTPARHAVITEGPSDALLLPALLREALGKGPDHPLDLQVAGGLAWTPPRLLPSLEAEAAHVVYLTDSDEEGDKYSAALHGAGVDPKRCFRLTAGSLTGLSIEDFVAEGAYAEVVDLLLREERDWEGESFTKIDVPSVGAAKATEAWATKRKLEPLSKTRIAEHLLRICGASLTYMYWEPDKKIEHQTLLRPGRRRSLLGLLGKMRDALELSGADD